MEINQLKLEYWYEKLNLDKCPKLGCYKYLRIIGNKIYRCNENDKIEGDSADVVK